MNDRRILLASDHTGLELRAQLNEFITALGYTCVDLGIKDGSPEDYVDITRVLLNKIDADEDLAILICGSGLGASIAANRDPNIRAGLCRTPDDARLARLQTNANVICLGSRFIDSDTAKECVKVFLETPFKAENHQASTNKLTVVNTKHADQGVNLIVRAVIILDGHILLSRPTATNTGFSQNQYFLPGGHVDYTESAISALNRELKEEMRINGKITDFIGALECSWQRKDSIYHEINLIYRVVIDGLSLNNPPKSTEHNLEFIWCRLEDLPNLTILPTKLSTMIQTYCSNATQAQFCSEML